MRKAMSYSPQGIKLNQIKSMKKNKVKSLIGQTCSHGSPSYPVVEVIADIVPFAGKALNEIINTPLWEIQFKSGCFTVLKEKSLHNLLDTGSCSYRRAAGFGAHEEISTLKF